jgi:hypothetical protein
VDDRPLQTDRDKQRLLDGLSAASRRRRRLGAVGDTISGLAKREFVLRRAGKDQPEVFTTRWAMSYLRGPLTRDQIAVLMAEPEGCRAHRSPVVAADPTTDGGRGSRLAVAPARCVHAHHACTRCTGIAGRRPGAR